MKNYSDAYNKLISLIVILGDILICELTFLGLTKLTGMDVKPGHFTLAENNLQTMLILMLCYAICATQTGVVLYRRKAYAYEVVTCVVKNVVYFGLLSGIILIAGQFIHAWRPMYLLYLLYLLTILVLITAYRLMLRFAIKQYRTRGGNLRFVVLVGSGSNMRELFHELTDHSWAGYRVLGYFDFTENPEFSKECPYLGKPQTVIRYLKEKQGTHFLYCSLPSKEAATIVPIIRYCENNLVHFFSVPNVHNYLHNRMYFNMIGNVPYLSLRRDPLSRTGNQILKRTFDIVFSLTFLCTLFPVIFLIVAVITKTTMPGPIFFKQKRNGLNDKEFYCYKFRSMKVNADADRVQATKDDPRKTKWGNIMRKTSIDELPQFINVLLGDMSVVGPRPHMVKHTEEYSKLINKYMVRHFVKPGITGWSQVTGYRGETKELKDMEGRIRGDIWYIEHWSFWLDIYIIYKTVANAIGGEKNAY